MPFMQSGTLVNDKGGVPTLEDIFFALARIPRFAGHTRQPWTVLDHSAYALGLAAEKGTPALQLAMLLHDAHECVTGDIPTDVKAAATKLFQQELDGRIMDRYFPGGVGAYHRLHDDVVALDRRALAAEAKVLGPAVENDAEREGYFGVPLEQDIAVLEMLASFPAQPGGVIQAVGILTDRIRTVESA